jgi:uncharacterized membrane protein YdbT with pleckstrin-like domain
MNPEQDKKPDSQQGPKQSDVAQKAAERRGRLFDPTGRVESLTSDETLVADVRRHPIGLLFLYIQLIVGIVVSLVLIIVFLPTITDVFGVNQDTASAVASLFALVTVSLGIIFLIIATRIYKGNQLIVSDKNITQVLQLGLFNRKVSELSMANVEDVTAQQGGILPTIFNYGVLRIETAGEQNNFHFIYCPNPNAYAKAILDSRLEYLARHSMKH